jgi:hypothetical protein
MGRPRNLHKGRNGQCYQRQLDRPTDLILLTDKDKAQSAIELAPFDPYKANTAGEIATLVAMSCIGWETRQLI